MNTNLEKKRKNKKIPCKTYKFFIEGFCTYNVFGCYMEDQEDE